MGQLVPCYLQDIVPGDRFRVNSELMMRMAPMLAPVMHRINVYIHYFFVPNRLVWNEWEEFITGGREGTSNPTPPIMTTDEIPFPEQFKVGSLADYMGLPVLLDDPVSGLNTMRFSALPFRMYQLIYNNYYRDQNLEPEIPISLTGGTGTSGELDNLMEMRTRAWEKDYFTSALPWAQRGGTVDIPLSSDPIGNPTQAWKSSDGTPYGSGANVEVASVPPNHQLVGSSPSDGGMHLSGDGLGVNINDLRRSMRLQEWLEKNARGGARYIEQILIHFGVKSSDARLQRPEFLGGGKQPVVLSEVLSTFQQDAEGIPQGNMAGHGISVGSRASFKRRFEEHGYVIGIMSVLPKTAYQQGVPRHFSRFDRFDYFWPEFANIGEQQIKLGELYWNVDDPAGTADELFGYTPRYSEYKYAPSTVHGEMRDSLDFWHMGRIFSSKPSLNASFVKSDPTTRIFAVTEDSEHLYCQLYNRVDAIRPMPYFGTPIL